MLLLEGCPRDSQQRPDSSFKRGLAALLTKATFDILVRPVMLGVVEAFVGRAPLHRVLCRLFRRAFTAAASGKTHVRLWFIPSVGIPPSSYPRACPRRKYTCRTAGKSPGAHYRRIRSCTLIANYRGGCRTQMR